jgi:hypothetical protein
MSRLSRFAAFVTICLAVIVAAEHLGMGAHSMSMLEAESPAMSVRGDGTIDGPPTVATEVGELHRASSGTMHLTVMSSPGIASVARAPGGHDHGTLVVMACVFMALVVLVGPGLRRLGARRSLARVLLDLVMVVTGWLRAVIRPGRPPGLTMLCVARC